MVKALEVEVSAFLSQSLETFETFDGDQIAALYCVPKRHRCSHVMLPEMMARGRGSMRDVMT
jgi:hypothetical protein